MAPEFISWRNGKVSHLKITLPLIFRVKFEGIIDDFLIKHYEIKGSTVARELVLASISHSKSL